MAGSGCTDNALAMSNDGVATSHRIAPEKELLSSLEELSGQLATFYGYHMREMRAIEREHQGLEALLFELAQTKKGRSSQRVIDELTTALRATIKRLHSKLLTGGTHAFAANPPKASRDWARMRSPSASRSPRADVIQDARAVGAIDNTVLAKQIAKEIIKKADRHCHNGQLSINEMRTFLKGTEFETFSSWLTQIPTFSRFDKNRNGAIDRKELRRALKEYLDTHQVTEDFFVVGNADASCASIPHFGVAGQPSQPGAGQPGMPRLPSLLGSVLPHGQGTSPSSGMAHDPMTGRPAETSGGEPSDACQCGSVFMLDAVFCRHCGTKRPPAPAPPLAAICPCGTAFIEGSMFCCMCGHKRIRDVASSSRSNAAAIASCDAEATLSSDAPMSSAASSSAPMSHAPASSVVDGAFSSVHNGLSSPRWAAVGSAVPSSVPWMASPSSPPAPGASPVPDPSIVMDIVPGIAVPGQRAIPSGHRVQHTVQPVHTTQLGPMHTHGEASCHVSSRELMELSAQMLDICTVTGAMQLPHSMSPRRSPRSQSLSPPPQPCFEDVDTNGVIDRAEFESIDRLISNTPHFLVNETPSFLMKEAPSVMGDVCKCPEPTTASNETVNHERKMTPSRTLSQQFHLYAL